MREDEEEGMDVKEESRRRICPQWKSAEGLSSMHFLCWRLISQYGFGAARVAFAFRASASSDGMEVCTFRLIRW